MHRVVLTVTHLLHTCYTPLFDQNISLTYPTFIRLIMKTSVYRLIYFMVNSRYCILYFITLSSLQVKKVLMTVVMMLLITKMVMMIIDWPLRRHTTKEKNKVSMVSSPCNRYQNTHNIPVWLSKDGYKKNPIVLVYGNDDTLCCQNLLRNFVCYVYITKP